MKNRLLHCTILLLSLIASTVTQAAGPAPRTSRDGSDPAPRLSNDVLNSGPGFPRDAFVITCIGASITEGARLDDPSRNSYPGQLQRLLGSSYTVNNFGVSSATLLRKGDLSYWKTRAYQDALRSNPSLVFVDLGGNDSKLVNRVHLDELEKDCRDLIHSFSALASHPRIVLMLPFPSFVTDTTQIWDPVIVSRIIPGLQAAAFQERVQTLDMHSLFIDQDMHMPDKIHPDLPGTTMIAKRLYTEVTRPRDKGFNLFPAIGLPLTISSYYGYACASLTIDGRECKVVRPVDAAPGHPWIWRARFWGHEPQTEIALLERGYHVVYSDVAELFGNKEAVSRWNKWYEILHNGGLSDKAVLEGMSRGAVYAFNWAAENPDKVAAVYVDNPLLDLKMWPAGLGIHPPAGPELQQLKADYALNDEVSVRQFTGSPIDKIPAIVAGRYPMLILCADADEAVSPAENTLLFEKKIKEQGGDITVIHKPGFKHHPHSLPNPSPIVNFIEKAVQSPATAPASAPDRAVAPPVSKHSPATLYPSYNGLIMAGYQGWFRAAGDGSAAKRYAYGDENRSAIDLWPDVSEYQKTYETPLSLPDGKKARFFSSLDASTTDLHFSWMKEYGVDGVFMQRFFDDTRPGGRKKESTTILRNALEAASKYKRAISVMYDLSGLKGSGEDCSTIIEDWKYLVDSLKVTNQDGEKTYLHHRGKPLVVIWGVGFPDRPYDIRNIGLERLISFLKNDPVYGNCSVMLGVPTFWRDLNADCVHDPYLHELIKQADIVLPWAVQRFSPLLHNDMDRFRDVMTEDMKWCSRNNVDYVPCVYPGFSWHNLSVHEFPDDIKPVGSIPRQGGRFYWQLLSTAIRSGAKMLYVAMFDEVNEGTAIFKASDTPPVGKNVQFIDMDHKPSDTYLWLTGEAGKMLRGEKPLSAAMPQRK